MRILLGVLLLFVVTSAAKDAGVPADQLPIIALAFIAFYWFVFIRKNKSSKARHEEPLDKGPIITNALYRLDGINDVLEIFESKLTITPKRNIASLLIRGMKGSKTIPFSSITAIQFREANPINGYLQFSLLGGIENGAGVFAAIGDENSCFFTEKNNALANEIRNYIELKIGTGKNSNSQSPSSLADEVQKLARLNSKGILSDIEFVAAKRRLME